MLKFIISSAMAVVLLASTPLVSAKESYEGPALLTQGDEVVGIITINPAMTAPMAACAQISGTVKIEGLQFSDSGKTLKSFYFEDVKGNNWSVPTNFENLSLNTVDSERANNFIKKGRSYFVRLQSCGSGGFIDLLDIYSAKAIDNL